MEFTLSLVLDGLLQIIQLLHHANRFFADTQGRAGRGYTQESEQQEGRGVLSQGLFVLSSVLKSP